MFDGSYVTGFNGESDQLIRAEIVRVAATNKHVLRAVSGQGGTAGVVISGNVGPGGSTNVCVDGGPVEVLLVNGLTPVAGDKVYLSTTPGRGTNVANSDPPVGTIFDASTYATSGFVRAVVKSGGGTSGATGVGGATGVAPSRGATGATGAGGATGIAGATGATGIGATGVVGATGTTGATGAGGATGASGVRGATGVVGATGTLGSPGAQGQVFPKTIMTIGGLYNIGTNGSWIGQGVNDISGIPIEYPINNIVIAEHATLVTVMFNFTAGANIGSTNVLQLALDGVIVATSAAITAPGIYELSPVPIVGHSSISLMLNTDGISFKDVRATLFFHT